MGHFFLQRVCRSALPAVFAAAVTSCWALQHHPHHPGATATAAARTRSSSTGSRVYCEAAAAARQQQEDDRESAFPLDPAGYQQMDLPDRASADSHVIYGALLADNLVESYHAYRKLSDNTVVAVVQLGRGVDGHPGVVHGGILALLMDDVLGFGYEALGDVPMAVTANLNINYLQAVPAGACVLVQAALQQREGRKLHWKVRVVSAEDESVIYCEATSLFIIPRDVYERSNNETEATR